MSICALTEFLWLGPADAQTQANEVQLKSSRRQKSNIDFGFLCVYKAQSFFQLKFECPKRQLHCLFQNPDILWIVFWYLASYKKCLIRNNKLNFEAQEGQVKKQKP